MKFIVSVILTAFLAFAAGLYGDLPWWLFAITSLIVAIAIPQKPGKAFLSGFLALFLLWVLLAAMKDMPNHHLLSEKVAKVLPLGGSYVALILITGIVGGLVSGLAALTGSYARRS
jgi:cbb3-type cytochrome oxidase subunit 1